MTGVLSRFMQSKMEPTPFAREKLDEANKNSSHQRNTVSIISANAAIKNKKIQSRFSNLKQSDAMFSNMMPRNGDESVRELTIDSDSSRYRNLSR